jgi:hypothetical protein
VGSIGSSSSVKCSCDFFFLTYNPLFCIFYSFQSEFLSTSTRFAKAAEWGYGDETKAMGSSIACGVGLSHIEGPFIHRMKEGNRVRIIDMHEDMHELLYPRD